MAPHGKSQARPKIAPFSAVVVAALRQLCSALDREWDGGLDYWDAG